jgi:hypothetical protein
MPGTDPNATEALQQYLRMEFSPTHEKEMEEVLDFGWHRVNVRPKKYKFYPFNYYQYNTSNPLSPALGLPPILFPALAAGSPGGDAANYNAPGAAGAALPPSQSSFPSPPPSSGAAPGP